MTLQINRKHFTVDEYYKLAETGIIKPSDQVELIEGDIITMSPINSNHAGIVNRLANYFIPKLSEKAIVIIQNPLRLSRTSEPEPDITIAKYKSDYYCSAHPNPDDVYLILEVADSSLAYDQSIKASLYAKARIPEYWIINLLDNQVEIHRQPKNGEFHFKQIFSEPAIIQALNIELEVDFETVFNG